MPYTPHDADRIASKIKVLCVNAWRDFDARLMEKAKEIAEFHRKERFRLLKNGAQLALKRQQPYQSFIDEAKTIDLNKLNADSADTFIKVLESFIASLDEPEGNFEPRANPDHIFLVDKFLASSEALFYLD